MRMFRKKKIYIIFSTFCIHFNRHTDKANLVLGFVSQLPARFGFRNFRTAVWCSEKNPNSAASRLELLSWNLPLNSYMTLGCIYPAWKMGVSFEKL